MLPRMLPKKYERWEMAQCNTTLMYMADLTDTRATLNVHLRLFNQHLVDNIPDFAAVE